MSEEGLKKTANKMIYIGNRLNLMMTFSKSNWIRFIKTLMMRRIISVRTLKKSYRHIRV